ncbi:hypothetical protein BRARA_E02853 [Brassica rapa]|uniref:Actin-related protein 5 n=1 Tax=Brassica campestris TaxID=3711 RepID=A0A397ZG12_BRACM|nr:hypothetical protein BRARA_E02853 [Brassica rapa]
MPIVSKTRRQTDYNLFPPSVPIVIDNGASYFRIGWAGETEPRVVFRNIVQRPRHKATGETVTIVGDQDPAMMKFFDCTRSGPRSAFDSNVVYQFEIMEYILDFAFDRLGASGSAIDHPILITECVGNPVYSRSKMAELLFETYGVPSVAFGVDAAFSYKYNQRHGKCKKDGIVICPGFTTTHTIPFVDGEPVYKGSCRTNIGGYHVTDYLKQLLSLKYPFHSSIFTWEKAEELKLEHCFIAPDYVSEARKFQEGTKEAEEKTRYWQLPWIPPPVEVPPSEEEIARKAAIREKQGQRLREMAEAKRSSKINEMENELHSLHFLVKQLDQVEEDDIPSFLSDTGYASRQELESTVSKVTQALRKARGEPKDEADEFEENTDSNEKYPLINVPDNMLTPEQIKDKKKQLFLKTTTEGRLRARQKRNEEELEKERRNQLEEERRRENPEFYLEEMRAQYKEVLERVEQKKRLKTNGSNTNGNQKSGNVGRGERLSAAKRERMRLLTTAAFDRGKGEDTFGAKDEDWQLYKLMSKDHDEDDERPDSDEAELARLSSRLQEIDPTFEQKAEGEPGQASGEAPRVRPLTEEDYKIVIGVERFRCPEILFHPNLVGIDQVGLDEMVGASIRRLPHDDDKELEEKLTSSILMTGGCSLVPGMKKRLECGIRMIRPCGSTINVVQAKDPVLDAWRGASAFAADLNFLGNAFTKKDYYEKGEEWLRSYQIQYNTL